MMRMENVTEADLQKYGLAPADRTVPILGRKYQALPAAAIPTVWQRADKILRDATEMYYGRSKPEADTVPAK